MKVYDFMCSESIEDLMLSKLTSDELLYAKEEISRLTKLPKEELIEKIKEGKENYESLSMVDSCTLHMICNINYHKSLNNFKSEIDAKIEQNDVMKQRSLYHASKTFI